MRHLINCSIVCISIVLFGCSSLSQRNLTVIPSMHATSPGTRATSSTIPTVVLTASPPPTSIPTLTSQEAEIAIRQMLNQVTSCAKPCIFGVIPNQTTVEEAQNLYDHLNMNFGLTYEEGNKQYYEAGYGFTENWGIVVNNIIVNSLVRDIRFNINLVNYTGPIPQQEWLAFRPNTILKQNGQPSEVKLSLSFPVESGFPAGTALYDIVMYFPSSDLIVKYDYELTNAGEQVTVCPLIDKSLGMNMWLGKEPHNPPEGVASLAEATTLSVEQFYDLLTRNSQQACFKLNPKAFLPKP